MNKKKITDSYLRAVKSIKAYNDADKRLEELNIAQQTILHIGYDIAAMCFNKYDTTKEFIESIYPCEAFGEQCCLYCRKYGECNGND